jgi:hypothetical protein
MKDKDVPWFGLPFSYRIGRIDGFAINYPVQQLIHENSMKTPIAFILLTAITLHASAVDRRPHVIHTDNESCMYSYYGNETYVACDKSATALRVKFEDENARIDKQEAREQEKRDDHAASDHKLEKERQERIAAMVADSPKGWTCVIKRLPPGMDLLSMDYKSPLLDKCSKEFDADDAKTKKTKKK